MRHSDLVYVKRIKGKGRGVFAKRPIPEGAVIERVPTLVVAVEDIAGVNNNPVLSRVCFIRNEATVSIALGYGSLYNHSFAPNAVYEEAGSKTMIFRALRPIDKDEEITINYNGSPEDRESVGFLVV